MPSRNEENWQAMLRRIAERDGSVELSRGIKDDDANVVMYRSRVFAVQSNGSIIVEMPRQALHDRIFQVGGDIDLTLMVNSERMVATCTLCETISYNVNPTLKVTCYRLSPGRWPMREQRRAFFRVSVAAIKLKPVMIHCDDLEGMSFECQARLVNISAGGIGISIRAARKVLGQVKRTRQFSSSFWLSDDEQVQAPVRVEHISALGEDGLYLGLKFDIEDLALAKQHEQLMQQRCTEFQRMQLRRRKRA